ncbi:MAG: hypothetical protein COT55_02220 [Candidatus Diapherotrites archaeon CG09_land_8_20_14_0_10_32_12]|nr:MAG: hypothetical protein COT55_02220 [Candidatus Diapherotrites archaeon CG09_land_8_20_14_0_10_32_12]
MNFKKINSKGQSSVEFMIIFGVALVIFLFLFGYTSTFITSQNKDTIQKTTQYYLNNLTKAANEVYFQGVGATKKIYFYVPDGVDENSVGVENSTVYMDVFGSTLWSKSGVNLVGQLPSSGGGHYLYLRTYPDYVLISPSILVVNKEVLYELMSKSTYLRDPIIVTNFSDDTVDVKTYLTWNNPAVSLTVDTDNFNLVQTEIKTINVDINTTALSSGLYFGNLRIAADFNEFEDVNIDIPITIDVVSGYGSGTIGSIVVNPPSKTLYIYKGDTETVTFTVCNISATDLYNVTLTSDNYDINVFTYPISSIPYLQLNNCVFKDVDFTPSLDYDTGSYYGQITLESAAQTVTIDLNVNVLPYRWSRIAYDDFPTANYNGGSGWLIDWYKTGQVSIISTDNPHSPSYHMQLLKGGIVYRTLNMQNKYLPKLEFYGKITGFIPGDEAYLDVSSNGTSWSRLESWGVTNSNATYTFYTFDLTNYTNNSSQFYIKFSRNGNQNQIASLEIDDVNVFETVPAE